jgi:hypothetical protein
MSERIDTTVISALRKRSDENEIAYVENVLRPHLFGGRPYFQAT